jgi:hypothetical protein
MQTRKPSSGPWNMMWARRPSAISSSRPTRRVGPGQLCCGRLCRECIRISKILIFQKVYDA